MIVRCPKCKCTNDLTPLNVNVGHVLDCVDCEEQLKVLASGDSFIAIRTVDIPRPTPPEMPTKGPGAPRLWENRKEEKWSQEST